MKKQYWMGIIGPEDPNKYQRNGADSPLKDALRDAFGRMFGHQEEVLASGWGIDEERYELLRTLHIMPTQKLKELLKNEKI